MRGVAGLDTERDVRDLHRTEYEGESAATPFIAVLGVFLFFATIFALILASSLIAYYLAV